MKTLSIPVVIIRTKTGYNAFSPAVDGCVATGKNLDRLLGQFREALEFHFEGQKLVKYKTVKTTKILRDAFADYGEDALYASINLSA